MHETSGAHGGADSDFCFVFWVKTTTTQKPQANRKTHFNNIS
jgi:hypothetical protein